MYVARLLYPVKVLGPGNRLGIWFQGCPRRCRGCSNPELWEQDEKRLVSLQDVMELVRRVRDAGPIDGFTLSGGDPFYQPEALAELLPELNRISGDILVYTGYTYEELAAGRPGLLAQIAVLIDGEYVEELNSGSLLKGSDNQTIRYLREEYRPLYEEYLRGKPLQVQNFAAENGIISAGIHKPGYREELIRRLAEKQAKEDTRI
ncbi:MAG: radical SAM protein [Abditibacteriota bacterium]|nr:radical SAM protein [Abditibacteriota bacterium]